MKTLIECLNAGDRFLLYDPVNAYVSTRMYVVGERRETTVRCHAIDNLTVTMDLQNDSPVIQMR